MPVVAEPERIDVGELVGRGVELKVSLTPSGEVDVDWQGELGDTLPPLAVAIATTNEVAATRAKGFARNVANSAGGSLGHEVFVSARPIARRDVVAVGIEAWGRVRWLDVPR